MKGERFQEIKPWYWVDAHDAVPAEDEHVIAIYVDAEFTPTGKDIFFGHPDIKWCEAYHDRNGWWRETKDKAFKMDNVLYWMYVEIPEEVED